MQSKNLQSVIGKVCMMMLLCLFLTGVPEIQAQPQVKAIDRPVIAGDQIVLYSASNEVAATIPLQGKKVDKITDWSTRYVLYKTLTEDGFPNGILKIYNIQTGESRELSGYYIASATLSPDSQKIATVTYLPESKALYLFDVHTLIPIKLVNEDVQPYSVQWNLSGDKLAYTIETEPMDLTANQEFITDIEYIEIENGQKQRITNTGTAYTPRWQNEQDVLFEDNSVSTSHYALT